MSVSKFRKVDGLTLAAICPDCGNVIHIKQLSMTCSQCGLRLRIDDIRVDKKGIEIAFVEDIVGSKY